MRALGRNRKQVSAKVRHERLYARREPTTDPDLPPRTYAKDVVIAEDPEFTREAKRFRWNDPSRPRKTQSSGHGFLHFEERICRLTWMPDILGDWEKPQVGKP